jgi:hypothetical protein
MVSRLFSLLFYTFDVGTPFFSAHSYIHNTFNNLKDLLIQE